MKLFIQSFNSNSSFSVLLPFLQYFVFAMKNIVVLFGMNPVVWIRMKMKEIIQIRREMGVRIQCLIKTKQNIMEIRHNLLQKILFSKIYSNHLFSYRQMPAPLIWFSKCFFQKSKMEAVLSVRGKSWHKVWPSFWRGTRPRARS